MTQCTVKYRKVALHATTYDTMIQYKVRRQHTIQHTLIEYSSLKSQVCDTSTTHKLKHNCTHTVFHI